MEKARVAVGAGTGVFLQLSVFERIGWVYVMPCGACRAFWRTHRVSCTLRSAGGYCKALSTHTSRAARLKGWKRNPYFNAALRPW